MNPAPAGPLSPRPPRCRAFTLVEVLIAAGIGVLVMAAVATLMVVSLQLYYKNRMVSDAAEATRLVQEHLNRELSLAVSQGSPIAIHPTYSDPGSNASAAYLTPPPVRFGAVTYRVSLGTPAKVVTAYPQASSTGTPVVIVWPASMDLPEPDDRFLLDSLPLSDPFDSGPGIRIDHCTRSGGTISVYLTARIIDGNHTADTRDIAVDSVTLLQRVRRYETNHAVAGDAQRCELQWFASPHAAAAILTKGVDAQNRFLFAPVPDATADEQAVSWAFSYLNPERTRHTLLPGATRYFQTNYAEGLVMPKSGNPLSPNGTPGTNWNPARISTTLYSTTVDSTTTVGTTTTKGTSTTKKTTTTTSTVGTTTTTLGTTIRSTTTKATSTTKRTTTTTKGTTTVNQSTTTTTKGSSTTAQSTTTKATTTIQGD